MVRCEEKSLVGSWVDRAKPGSREGRSEAQVTVQVGEGGGRDWSRGTGDRTLRDVSNRIKTDRGGGRAAGAGEGSWPAADPLEQDQRAARSPPPGGPNQHRVRLSKSAEGEPGGHSSRATERPGTCWGGSRSGPEWGSSLLAFDWHPVAPCAGLGPRASAGGLTHRQGKQVHGSPKASGPGAPCPTGLCEQRPQVSANKALVFSDCINRTSASGSMLLSVLLHSALVELHLGPRPCQEPAAQTLPGAVWAGAHLNGALKACVSSWG